MYPLRGDAGGAVLSAAAVPPMLPVLALTPALLVLPVMLPMLPVLALTLLKLPATDATRRGEVTGLVGVDPARLMLLPPTRPSATGVVGREERREYLLLLLRDTGVLIAFPALLGVAPL